MIEQSSGPIEYFDVEAAAGQIILTPVRIQRSDAVRAKLTELAIDSNYIVDAANWARRKT